MTEVFNVTFTVNIFSILMRVPSLFIPMLPDTDGYEYRLALFGDSLLYELFGIHLKLSVDTGHLGD